MSKIGCFPHVKGALMPANLLHEQITVALLNTRRARDEGDPKLTAIAEDRLNRLLDRLELVAV